MLSTVTGTEQALNNINIDIVLCCLLLNGNGGTNIYWMPADIFHIVKASHIIIIEKTQFKV